MERIIANLDKVKLKLDEAFFYLDEIEELVQDEVLDGEAASRVGEANDRLTKELSSLGHKVAELQDILRALEEREEGGAEGVVFAGGRELGPDPGQCLFVGTMHAHGW